MQANLVPGPLTREWRRTQDSDMPRAAPLSKALKEEGTWLGYLRHATAELRAC